MFWEVIINLQVSQGRWEKFSDFMVVSKEIMEVEMRSYGRIKTPKIFASRNWLAVLVSQDSVHKTQRRSVFIKPS